MEDLGFKGQWDLVYRLLTGSLHRPLYTYVFGLHYTYLSLGKANKGKTLVGVGAREVVRIYKLFSGEH